MCMMLEICVHICACVCVCVCVCVHVHVCACACVCVGTDTIDFMGFASIMREQLKLFCQRRLGNFIASVQHDNGQVRKKKKRGEKKK